MSWCTLVVFVCSTFEVPFLGCCSVLFFFFKQKTAYEMRISDWSSDVCSSDLRGGLEADFGVTARYSAADMSKADQIVMMIAEHEQAFGGLDILLNNAGIQHVAPIEEFPPEKWDAIIAINLSSAFHSIRAAVPGMKRSEEHTSELQSLMRISY